MDIAEFVRAQLDEDERRTIAFRNGHPGQCLNYPGQSPEGYDEHDSCYLHIAAAKGSPYMDTTFGLADIAAKRRLLELCIGMDPDLSFIGSGFHPGDETELAAAALAQLAAPYAEHPDYRTEWAPGTP